MIGQRLSLRCVQLPLFQFSLEKTISIIGRAPTCDFVLDAPSISRRHAELRIEESGLQVVDLGSRNGTFVCGSRVQTCQVQPNEIVRFGHVDFALVNLQSPSEIETDEPASPENSPVEPSPLGNIPLSTAQQRVFQSLLEGLAEKAIAHQLGLSTHTIHNHIRAIFRSFGVHSRSQLIALLLRRIGMDLARKT